MWVTSPVGLTVPHTSDCIFQLKWKITTEIQLYIQKSPRNTESQAELWHVPPLPGPSQGNLKPRFALSGISRELRANSTPLRRINTVIIKKARDSRAFLLRETRKSTILLIKWLKRAIAAHNILSMLAVVERNLMRPEEVIVLRVLRFVVVGSLAVALLYMAYNG